MKIVLVVEDNQAARELLERFLRILRQVAVVSVGDGQEAWGLLDGGVKFDLIISDHNLPGMSGLELLRRVREDNRMTGTPFALMSGDVIVSKEDPTRLEVVCARLRATFWSKPCDYNALITELLEDEK